VAQTGTRPQIEEPLESLLEESGAEGVSAVELRMRAVEQLRLYWGHREFLGKALLAGLVVGLLVAFLIPARYESTVQLMPPDSQSTSGMAMLAALTSKAGSGNSNLGGLAGDLLGVKTSGALFIGVLGSRTVQERIVERFQLKKVYWKSLDEDARKKLADRTALNEDHKSGIISITVTDRDPRRAAAIAEAYVQELNQLVAELSTSSAHRERVFLEERLSAVKHDLDDASKNFSQFASKNAAIDIKAQGEAMVEAAAKLQGEMIAAQSELKGLEQIYMPDNVRVRAVQARISELQSQLAKLGGNSNGQMNPASASSDSPYPSIRELPLLGVTWGDLYRRTRIQEAVFETLTQQYELAKVQEAKEIPSVKELDPAQVPERKSFPPRTLITFLVGFLFLGAAILGVFMRVQWNQTDDKDPGKVFAREVFQTANARMPWATRNGSNSGTMAQEENIGQTGHQDVSKK
jgi:capsule polysaccharide export protein KpsE/RkpR